MVYQQTAFWHAARRRIELTASVRAVLTKIDVSELESAMAHDHVYTVSKLKERDHAQAVANVAA